MGPTDIAEARVGRDPRFLSADRRHTLTRWWLAKQRGAVPNWDIASTASISGQQGLLLVEAKAHDRELSAAGKPPGNADNDRQIRSALAEANRALSATIPGWSLSCETHYQLANRIAWAWRIATEGTPVVLIYLGFLNAREMSDCGAILSSHAHWQRGLLDHSKAVVPHDAWDRIIPTASAPFVISSRSLEVPFSP